MSLGINATLRYCLDYLVQNGEQIDEPGVYQLFRIILKMQEYIAELKKNLAISATDKFIADTRVWSKAEYIIQILNLAVFAGTQKSSSNDAHLSDIYHATPSACIEQHLSIAEQQAWRGLVRSQGRATNTIRAFSLRRHRLKGTVFVALELDFTHL